MADSAAKPPRASLSYSSDGVQHRTWLLNSRPGSAKMESRRSSLTKLRRFHLETPKVVLQETKSYMNAH